MEYVGFINAAHNIEHLEELVSSMRRLPCAVIFYEENDDNDRQKWKAFIGQLNHGDVAVLLSFDNAFKNFSDLMFFLKLCSSKNIRIISIKDSLDSEDVIFPKASTKKTLDAIASMTSVRGKDSFDDFEEALLSDKYHEKKLKKYMMVINMYNAGYSIKEIMSRTGYHGKSNIYRILHRFNVELEYPTMVRSNQPNQGVIMRNL